MEQNQTVQIGPITVDLQAPNTTREDAFLECDREMGVRVRCFPDWYAKNKLSAGDARARLQGMAKACQILSTVMLLTEQDWKHVVVTSEQRMKESQAKSEPAKAA
jgi:hypothetical protein